MPRSGEQDPDDLGSLADRAGVGLRVLLIGLLIRREPEVGRELADLAEPALGVLPRRGVVAGEGVGDGSDQIGLQAAEPGVFRIGYDVEQLVEEVPVDRPEVGPLAQVLARVVGVLALDGQGAQGQRRLASRIATRPGS